MSNPPTVGTRKHRVTLWIIAAVVAFFTWGLSPIKPDFVLIVFAFALFVILNLRKSYPEESRRYVLWWVVFVVAVMGTATIHDITITSYASALCCDGTYSFSEHRSGTCSWHHGVCAWTPELPPWWKRF